MNKSLLAVLLFSFLSTTAIAQVNVRINPLATVIGHYNVDVDFVVEEGWTLGPSVNFLSTDIDGYEIRGWGAGARANYWFNKAAFSQGWYLGQLLSYASVRVEKDSDFGKYEGEADGFGYTVLGGYQWVWESFNINLGAGPSFYRIGDITVKDDEGNKTEFTGYSGINIALEFTLGWKF